MVLVWRGTGAMSTGQLRAAVQTLLGSTLDLAVHLDLDDVRRVDLPQIRSTPVAPELLARARCIAEVDRDLVSPRELLRAREALGSDVGRVILAEGKCTLTSFRALNRAQRWQATTGDVHLMDRLFGTVRLV